MSSLADLSEVLLELGLEGEVTETERAIAQKALKSAIGAVKRHLGYDPTLAVRTEYLPKLDSTFGDRGGVWEVDDTQAHFRRLSESASEKLQLSFIPIREFDEDGANGIDLKIDYDGRSGSKADSFSGTSKAQGTDYWPNYDLVDANGYKVCTDGILHSHGRWPAIAGSVKVIYVAGYTTAELRGEGEDIDASPLNEAVIDESVRRVHKIYSRRKNSRLGFGRGGLTSERLGDYSYAADPKILDQLVGSMSDILPETSLKLEGFANFGAMLGG